VRENTRFGRGAGLALPGRPGIQAALEHGERHRAAGQNLVVESAQVEFLTQLLFVAGAQLAQF